MTVAAVSDASPLIHLAEIDSLQLLSNFDTLLVPEAVYEELERGGVPDRASDLSYESVEANMEGSDPKNWLRERIHRISYR